MLKGLKRFFPKLPEERLVRAAMIAAGITIAVLAFCQSCMD